MKVELWSIYYPPVPLGIGPVAGLLASELAALGHDVTAVTSHPHYPTPEWGTSFRRRRHHDGSVKVVELPVYPRRRTAIQRAAEEATYGFKQTTWALRGPQPDVVIATVPSLLCLPGAMARARLHGTPFVIWLQDIVSAGAASTGLTGGARLAGSLARLERAGFLRADRIVVISDAFASWLAGIGVAEERIARIGLATDREICEPRRGRNGTPRAVVIGNIGLSQGLPDVVRAFERSPELGDLGAELEIAGGGVEVDATKAAIESSRVRYRGLVPDAELDAMLAQADVGLITQTPGLSEFNLPSKMLAYMSAGLPVAALTDPGSEISRVVEHSGGASIPNADLDEACRRLAEFLRDREGLERASREATEFARENFDPGAMAARFEAVLEQAVASRRRSR